MDNEPRATLSLAERVQHFLTLFRQRENTHFLERNTSNTAIMWYKFPQHELHRILFPLLLLVFSCVVHPISPYCSRITSSTKPRYPATRETSRLLWQLQTGGRDRKTQINLRHDCGYETFSIGIDLGTTYSSVSVIENGQPTVLNIDGSNTVPSVVGYTDHAQSFLMGSSASTASTSLDKAISMTVIVGQDARDQQFSNAENTFSSVKRIIGKTYKEVQRSGDSLFISRLVYPKARKDNEQHAYIANDHPKASRPAALLCPALRTLKTTPTAAATIRRPEAIEQPMPSDTIGDSSKDNKLQSELSLRGVWFEGNQQSAYLLPEEISAEVLRKLIYHASRYFENMRPPLRTAEVEAQGAHHSNNGSAVGSNSNSDSDKGSGCPGPVLIERAVITVPAYFSAAQRAATERAGRLAGLKKIRLLKEPEAAALAYGLDTQKQQLVLVFDLGGGTFDCSVLEVGDGFVEVIATSGDEHLGGDDFDQIIEEWLLEHLFLQLKHMYQNQQDGHRLGNYDQDYKHQHGEHPHNKNLPNESKVDRYIGTGMEYRSDCTDIVPLLLRAMGRLSSKQGLLQYIKSIDQRAALQLRVRLKQSAVQAKESLSSHITTQIELPNLIGNVDLSVELTRRKFESLSKPLLNSILKPLRQVAIMAGINLPGESAQQGADGWEPQWDGNDSDHSQRFFMRGNKQRDKEVNQEEEEEEEAAEEEEENEGQTQQEHKQASGLSSNSIRHMQRVQLEGRRSAKALKKQRATSTRELRRLQKQTGDSSLTLFPGGHMLDEVLLVGGATRIPAVAKLVRTITGVDPQRSVNPDLAVCLGAGVQAGILDGTISNMQVMSAWQAAVLRTFYQEKQKGNNLYEILQESENEKEDSFPKRQRSDTYSKYNTGSHVAVLKVKSTEHPSENVPGDSLQPGSRSRNASLHKNKGTTKSLFKSLNIRKISKNPKP